MGEFEKFKYDLVQIARLAITGNTDDIRLYLARLVRQYRTEQPALSKELAELLRSHTSNTKPQTMRRFSRDMDSPQAEMPVDDDTKMELLKRYSDESSSLKPILSSSVNANLDLLIKERLHSELLASKGLDPSKSAIFVGAPGLGKTITARWIASQLEVPLYVLDLSAVMSSLLGRSGANLRNALDFAKQTPCVLLLDEIDAIAKKRSDDSDIGELKRLVTVILQEVDEWPASGLLLAATNHAELIDPALWRRFDSVIEFTPPDTDSVLLAVQRFLGPDLDQFRTWLEVFAVALQGESFSDIERYIRRLRRSLVIETRGPDELAIDLVQTKCSTLSRQDQLKLAVHLENQTKLSQRRVSEITGFSRDTIRKHRQNKQMSE